MDEFDALVQDAIKEQILPVIPLGSLWKIKSCLTPVGRDIRSMPLDRTTFNKLLKPGAYILIYEVKYAKLSTTTFNNPNIWTIGFKFIIEEKLCEDMRLWNDEWTTILERVK